MRSREAVATVTGVAQRLWSGPLLGLCVGLVLGIALIAVAVRAS